MTMAKSHSKRQAQKEEKQSKRHAQRIAAQKENSLRRMKKNVMWAIVVLISLAIIITLLRSTSVSTEGLPELSLTQTAETDYPLGTNDKIVIMEYSDFQCPACRSVEPLVKALVEKYGDNITFVYRDFPLKQIHAKATIAAQAAHAAGAQGKYWEMHNMLFEMQEEWATGSHVNLFIEYATTLNLNVTQFELDLNSDETKAIVTNNYEHGLSLGIQGTPTFFLNGKRVSVTGLDDFSRRIDSLLR